MESIQKPDAVLIGAGIMSVTLASLLKRLDPSMEIVIYEVLGSEAGHAALCELNYTPEDSSGDIDISKALTVNTEFDLSRQFWASLVREGAIKNRRPLFILYRTVVSCAERTTSTFWSGGTRRSPRIPVTKAWSTPMTRTRYATGFRWACRVATQARPLQRHVCALAPTLIMAP